ncbi:HNH endonuclease [Staphylococcus hominis]|uniref:HNH endonuclease n=1 Tax=Staphylococcus hominis TaxID=1290 RepID=UPI000917FB0C|nr:HNH endonuclease [Staphylococcus hominis]MCI2882010.1 HNH endonuclease [Staphylococcus hominis]MDS3906305.1 HNH endonuclease [Staphylococcus hominis]MEB5575235.1 HNH endonuclease [Staphylococcus hominis]UQA65446.1 HNH endonuclease [Staphylococcus hominis subsp. hominis]SFW98842.1 HNH endonuclease [Staphylococcus hominis]
MENRIFEFSELENAPLVPNSVYKGGIKGNVGDDPFKKLFNVGNAGGIRTKISKDGNIAYIVIISNSSNSDIYPNNYNDDTSILTYYGDQKDSNKDAIDTKKRGNKNLKYLFDLVYGKLEEDINPFPVFYFEKIGNQGRNYIYKGLAFPYVKNLKYEEVCQIKTNNNISNYQFLFTIDNSEISTRNFIEDLLRDSQNFYNAPNNFKNFAEDTTQFKLKIETCSLHTKYLNLFLNNYVKTSEIIRDSKVRIGQDNVRKNLLYQRRKCEICGIDYPFLLIASHIIPWSKVKEYKDFYELGNQIRGDLNNTLLLCETHDKLFDRHYISFDINGKIMISENIRKEDYKKLNINENIGIKLNEKKEKYMKEHRKKFIEKNYI